MGCQSSKNDSKPQKVVTKKLDVEPAPDLGIYVIYENAELLLKWAQSPPEDSTILIFIKVNSKVPMYKLSSAAEVLCQAAVVQGIPVFEEIKMYPDASKNGFLPFKLAFHELGNGILGDTVQVLKDGESIQRGSIFEQVAVVPYDTTLFDDSPQSAEQFKQNVNKCGGKSVHLDSSGNLKPM